MMRRAADRAACALSTPPSRVRASAGEDGRRQPALALPSHDVELDIRADDSRQRSAAGDELELPR